MEYKPNIISSLFRGNWLIETRSEYLFYRDKNLSHKIPYLDVKNLIKGDGIFWDSLIIKIDNDLTNDLILKGLSEKTLNDANDDITAQVKITIAKNVSAKKRELSGIISGIKKGLEVDGYLSHKRILKLVSLIPAFKNKNGDLYKELTHSFLDSHYFQKELKQQIAFIQDIQSPHGNFISSKNEAFVENEINRYKPLFCQLEKYDLSKEQMVAAVTDEDANLVIAAAGSGKSSTILAKIAYLIDSGLANSDEILVLSYNKDVQLSLKRRLDLLGQKFPKLNTSEVCAKTFNAFGWDVIGLVTNTKPTISKLAEATDNNQPSRMRDLIESICLKNQKFAIKWMTFLAIVKTAIPDEDKVKTKVSYDRFLERLGKNALRTIDGNQVKSLEEVRIANWLVINGVEYEYERKYEYDTSSSEYKQYQPDFYYPGTGLYHEHFALNKHGKPPQFIGQDYLKEAKWKRSVHRSYKTKFIETHSAFFHDGTIFEKLETSLKQYDVILKQLSREQIDSLIEESFDIERDIQLPSTFLKHFKANNFTIKEIKKYSKSFSDRTRVNLFLSVFETIYKEYQKKLKEKNEIDFQDQINYAIDFIESNSYIHRFKYILVDEFQDMSQDKKRLLLSLLNQCEDTKLFAVGDDWQSINRFAGADLDIMKSFDSHFGFSSINFLTQTFRSYQGIVDVAAEFIQQNLEQSQKNVKALESMDGNQVIIQEYRNLQDQKNKLEKLLEQIDKKGQEKEIKLRVFLLARYNKYEPRKMDAYGKKYEHIDMDFMTVHRSKGLEADYVILLNICRYEYSFPSRITDDVLLNLVTPRPEKYEFAEERRLFYVALTRAKRAVYVFSEAGGMSEFIEELCEYENVDYYQEKIPIYKAKRRRKISNRNDVPWNDNEDKNLVNEFRAGLTFERLCGIHKRSIESIRTRLIKLGEI